jgi:hypothetical protein
MRLADYTLKLLGLSQTMRRWLGVIAKLDEGRQEKIARFADAIAGTLARTVDAFERIEKQPNDRVARRAAIRELGRLSGYVENIVAALEGHVDGRRLAGMKKRLEGLADETLMIQSVRNADAARIERLLASEGYFRALADGLRA